MSLLRPFLRQFLWSKDTNDTLPADPHEAAGWWAAKHALGTRPAREDATFARWLEDSENRAAYEITTGVYGHAAMHAGEPEILDMRAVALKAGPVPSRGRDWGRIAAATAAVVLIACGMGWALVDGASSPATVQEASAAASPAAKRYETKIGERHEVRLDDGSVVSLDTDSLLEVAYNSRERNIRLLRGQALFRVAHNQGWPFVVSAGSRTVTAVGTAFNVRVEGPRVKVVLIEGKVRVASARREGPQSLIPGWGEQNLAPGQMLLADQGDEKNVVSTADMQRDVSWTRGQLIFRDDSLGAAVAEFNRYSATPILVLDPRIAALKVSGVFNTDRPEHFVAAVTTFYPLKTARTTRGLIQLVWTVPA